MISLIHFTTLAYTKSNWLADLRLIRHKKDIHSHNKQWDMKVIDKKLELILSQDRVGTILCGLIHIVLDSLFMFPAIIWHYVLFL